MSLSYWLIAALFAIESVTITGPSLKDRVATALSDSPSAAALPEGAALRVDRMTPVRGEVLDIDITRYDPQSGYFSADLIHGSVRKQVTGRAIAEVSVMTLSRSIPAGEIISQDAVVSRAVPINRLPNRAATAPNMVVGKAARVSLPAGRPLSLDAIGVPFTIRRNTPVTLFYGNDRMTLSARGTALDDGGPGDIIRVLPDGSGRLVSGQVDDDGQVWVNGGAS